MPLWVHSLILFNTLGAYFAGLRFSQAYADLKTQAGGGVVSADFQSFLHVAFSFLVLCPENCSQLSLLDFQLRFLNLFNAGRLPGNNSASPWIVIFSRHIVGTIVPQAGTIVGLTLLIFPLSDDSFLYYLIPMSKSFCSKYIYFF